MKLTGRYFEDFAAGRTFRSGRRPIDKERIETFGAEFDPQPFHLDEDAARDTIFRGLAASGRHTAAVTMRLLVESDLKTRRRHRRRRGRRAPLATTRAPGMSCASRARSWRCGPRGRVQIRD
jgi:acyl dehydratase